MTGQRSDRRKASEPSEGELIAAELWLFADKETRWGELADLELASLLYDAAEYIRKLERRL